MQIHTPPSNLVAAWLGRLLASGYRLTEPRRAIVEIMADSPRALGPLDLYDLGRKEHPGLGLVTIYRTLEKLEDLGLVQRVHQPGGCHMYLRAAQGHQHILICTACKQVVYFSGDDLERLITDTARHSGFDIREHWLQLYGLCPGCQTKQTR